ncbi:hypothetical protein V8E55_012221 [Tylopilus felleus]
MSSPYDLVSYVLPQALRLARYQAMAKLPENVSDIQRENDTINQTPSKEERLIVSNDSVMTALENLFSWRHWCGFSEADDYKDREADLQKSWRDQKTFLQQFSTQELFQILKLALFLRSTARWAITAEGNGLGGTLYTCPHRVLRCFEDATSNHLPMEHLDDDGPYTKFITRSLCEITDEREVVEPIGYVGIILDEINGLHDRCTTTGRGCGGDGNWGIFESGEVQVLPCLYNETSESFVAWSKKNSLMMLLDWDDLKGDLDREYLVARNLTYNIVEKSIVQALSGNWSKLVREMFACKQGEYAQWSTEDWICAECWSSFFRDTMWRWRLARKEKKHGYDCEEQRFEEGLAHAKQFNVRCSSIIGLLRGLLISLPSTSVSPQKKILLGNSEGDHSGESGKGMKFLKYVVNWRFKDED